MTVPPMTPAAVRDRLVEALRLDLVGPDNDHLFAHELLPDPPSRWYLTGFLVPRDAPEEQRHDIQSTEELDAAAGPDDDDGASTERGSARKSYFPSSLGLSVLVPPGVTTLEVEAVWGDYVYEGGPEGAAEDLHRDEAAEAPGLRGFRRNPRRETLRFAPPETGLTPATLDVPAGRGLRVVVTARAVNTVAGLPAGTRALSVFLVNHRAPDEDQPSRAFAFQAGLVLRSAEAFAARPDPRGSGASAVPEWDERVADLQYRDLFEYATGHGVATTSCLDPDGCCREVRTVWIPSADVERVEPAALPEVVLSMDALADLDDGTAFRAALGPLVSQYLDWIAGQRSSSVSLSAARATTAGELLDAAEHAAARIEAGIALLDDADIRYAFRLANKAMAQAARRRETQRLGGPPPSGYVPAWRPFQLAYILLALRGIADPQHGDRDVVDLLFFPTGGGKTEAYLGLAAFTLVLRRLRHPGLRGAGTSVLMRYTLRLLTLDQLGRAAALVCALELERQHDTRLGPWPFEIGLWVGKASTPNRMGHQGYDGPGQDDTAYKRTNAYRADPNRARPVPLENCPWCGTRFEPGSFRLVPSRKPLNLHIYCMNHTCDFSSDRALPIVAVDEPIYRRLPAFLIATVDKFASLPWTGDTGALFGRIERYDEHGFYGPASSGGQPFNGRLPPPDLVIQDELHLISGPLGTIAGLYETAIDELATWEVNGRRIRPKVIASTATVRRADRQIRALFDRPEVSIFPPPGADRRDSFFAKTVPASEVPARRYVGVAAQGRSHKVVLLRTALAVLAAGETVWREQGGKRAPDNAADAYMTLLTYFNSLRELGGARRIVEDEVRARLGQYGRHRRRDPEDRIFSDREIGYEVLELTSRVSTGQVAEAKRRLSRAFRENDRVDVALATNMISVGLDITRLGLLVVHGQPKTSAEYIQATSRVGRDAKRPGLVIALLNIHKPRDRSHYERFETYHATFYRSVEATSVTPFSPRALDRALVGAMVALCRQGDAAMTAPRGAEQITARRAELEWVAERFAARAQDHDADRSPADAKLLHDHVLHTCRRLLDDWVKVAAHMGSTGTPMQYQLWEDRGPQRLLFDFLDPELQTVHELRRHFRANRSMRDVEASVELLVKNLNDWSTTS